MDRMVLLPSVALTLVALLAYCARCIRTGSVFDVSIIVSVVMNAAGVVAGTLLILASVDSRVRSAINDIEIYILLSGVAVLGMTGRALIREVVGDVLLERWLTRFRRTTSPTKNVRDELRE